MKKDKNQRGGMEAERGSQAGGRVKRAEVAGLGGESGRMRKGRETSWAPKVVAEAPG